MKIRLVHDVSRSSQSAWLVRRYVAYLGAVWVDMQGSQYEDQAGEGGVRRDGLQPVIIDVEQHHLRLRGSQYQVSELLYLEA